MEAVKKHSKNGVKERKKTPKHAKTKKDLQAEQKALIPVKKTAK